MCKHCVVIDDIMKEHIAMLLSSSPRKYISVNEFLTDQQLKDSVFMSLLRSRREAMTPSQRSKGINTTGMQWLYPSRVEREYQIWITRKMRTYSDIAIPVITENMTRWVEEYTTEATVTLDGYDTELDGLINKLRVNQQRMFTLEAERMNVELTGFGEAVGTHNQGQWEKFQKVSIGVTFTAGEPWIDATVKTWTRNNKSLLRGMTDEYIKKLEWEIAKGFQEGHASSEIIKSIRKMDRNMTRTRAKLLGRDQVGKLNGIYTQNRMKQAGLSRYVWLTAADERVRATHQKMNRTTNKWNDSSVLSRNGGKTFVSRPSAMQGATPGSQIQCRCTSKPDFQEIMGQVDKEIEEKENA